MKLTFTAHGHPVPQPRSRSSRYGRPYVPNNHPVHDWKTIVQFAFLEDLADGAKLRDHLLPFFGGPLSMKLTFRGAHWAADADNLAKAVLDALQGLAYANDRQVTHLEIIRERAQKADEGVLVEIEELCQSQS